MHEKFTVIQPKNLHQVDLGTYNIQPLYICPSDKVPVSR